jgi:hypothetical protein
VVEVVSRLVKWTPEEDAIVKKFFTPFPSSEIREKLKKALPNRSWAAIRKRAFALGLTQTFKDTPELKMTDFEKGFVVGMIEGEGSIILYASRGKIYPRIVIYNSNLELLRRIQAIIGGHISKNRKATERKVSCYALWIHQITQIKKILEELTPYLITKKRRAELLLKYINQRIKSNSRCYTNDVIQVLDEWNKMLKEEEEKRIAEKIKPVKPQPQPEGEADKSAGEKKREGGD